MEEGLSLVQIQNLKSATNPGQSIPALGFGAHASIIPFSFFCLYHEENRDWYVLVLLPETGGCSLSCCGHWGHATDHLENFLFLSRLHLQGDIQFWEQFTASEFSW